MSDDVVDNVVSEANDLVEQVVEDVTDAVDKVEEVVDEVVEKVKPLYAAGEAYLHPDKPVSPQNPPKNAIVSKSGN